jgi:hypothetical protein
MKQLTRKMPYELKEGEVVHQCGGTFLVKSVDVWTCEKGKPVGTARTTCLSGSCGNRFYPGSEWIVQGNEWAPVLIESE